MSDVNLTPPDFLDIDPETAAAAEATLKAFEPLKVPADAVVSGKSSDYLRWTESAVIEKAYRETGKTGEILSPIVQVRMRVGSPNGGARYWARHQMHLPTLANKNVSTGVNYTRMNEMSIAALTSLLRATGFMPEAGGLTSKLLNFLFPVKNAPGVESPLKGKLVIINMCESPNSKATDPKYKRQIGAESYLPDLIED